MAESTHLVITLATETITVEEFADAVSDIAAVLTAMDVAVSGGKRTTTFRITAIKYESPPQINAVAEPRDGDQTAPQFLRSLEQGLAAMGQAPEIPAYFSDDVLTNLKRLAERRFPVRIEAPAEQVDVFVSRPVVAAIDRAVQAGYALGGVEGLLTTVSIARQPLFSIADAVTGSNVRCALPTGMEWRKRVLALFGHKVIVTGEVRRDTQGRPVAMRNVVALAPTALHDRPVPDPSLVGSFGGLDMETKEYLREIRGE